MSWGAMGGIGEALTNLSANMAEMDKAKLRDKLETDREVARETREAAKLKRTTSYRKLTNGKWQSYNADDELLRETTATPEEIAKAQQDAELAALGIRKERAAVTVDEATAADAPAAVERKIAKHDQDMRIGDEQIRASRDRSKLGWAELGQRAKEASAKARESSGADVPDSQRALALIDSYKYILDDAIAAGRINAMEALRQAEDAITQAKANGTDAGKIFAARLGGFTDGNKGGRPGNYGRGLGVLIAPKYKEE